MISAYYDIAPDPAVPEQRVAFGTSGHRGSSLTASFNETHILATTQAIVDYRRSQGIEGPLFLGRDTHGLSLPAERSAIEVLVANGIDVRVDARDSWVPTPALSHAILTYNRGKDAADPSRSDGIVVTPSHNPPRDGGFKYNPPNGGPADTDATGWIADRANAAHRRGPRGRRAHAVPRHRRRHARRVRLPRRLRARPRRTSSTSRRSAAPACASAPTRWAAPRSSTGP